MIERISNDKELNRLCEQYVISKKAAAEKDKLSKMIKEKVGTDGSFCTSEYDINITMREEAYKVDPVLLKQKYPEIYEEVCVKVVPASLILSSVKPSAYNRNILEDEFVL